jgi:F0F1-type ATP synthase assembly protein I
MRSGPRQSGDLSQESGGRSAHRSPVTRTDAARSGRQFYHTLSASSAGLELGLSVVLCVLLGLWLDGRLGTRPWLMLAGLALGLVAGFRSVLRSVRRADRAAEREAREGQHG